MKNDWCLTQVKSFDYERYLTTLFMSSEKRAPLWALYAFHLEIAKTKHMVSQATLGLIRLQWWREAIHKLYQENKGDHQVLEALAPYKTLWTEDDFIALIDAYESDFTAEEEQTFQDAATRSRLLLTMALKVETTQDDITAIAEDYGKIRAARYDASLPFDLPSPLPTKSSSKTGDLYRRLVKIHHTAIQRGKRGAYPDPLLPLKLWLTR